jgi:hypothetical protein
LSWLLLLLYLVPVFVVVYLLDAYEREPLSFLVSMGGCIGFALTDLSAVEVVVGAVLGTASSRTRRGLGAVEARWVAAPDRPPAGQTGTVGARLRAPDRRSAAAAARRAPRCLSMAEREEVSRRVAVGESCRQVAARLGRAHRRCRGSWPATAAATATGPRPPTLRPSVVPSGPRWPSW